MEIAMRFSDVLRNIKIVRTNITCFDFCISRISSSTDSLAYGDVFVCRRGFRLDGHDYIKEAYARGARSFVVERLTPELLENDCYRYIQVDDTDLAEAMMQNAYFGYPCRNIKLVGITGTNGKTSVSYMLGHILNTLGHRVGIIGTVSSHVGDTVLSQDSTLHGNMTTPSPSALYSTLSKMRGLGADAVVLEASSHALDQRRVDALDFDLGIFTNLTEDHLDYHKTVSAYKTAKRHLFDLCSAALINTDSDFGRELADTLSGRVFTYGKNRTADFFATDVCFESGSTSYTAHIDNNAYSVVCPVPGEFSLYNSLAALSASVILGESPHDAAKALSTLGQIPGRLEKYTLDSGASLYIDYAHTPDALKNVLTTLSAIPHNRLITVFGCGGDREKQKRPLMGNIASSMSDITVVTGDNSRSERTSDIIADILSGIEDKSNVLVIEDRKEAILKAISLSAENDIILLAGKGHENYEIIGDTKRYFSEKDIINDFTKTPLE